MAYLKALCFLPALLLVGCNTSYTQKMGTSRAHLINAEYTEAIDALDGIESASLFLKHVETGRIAQLAAQFEKSQQAYAQADQLLDEKSLKAMIRGSEIARQGASMYTNDSILEYQPAPYEILMLYPYQALNYLALSKTQDAFVSLRRFGEQQTWIAEHYKEAINEAKEKLHEDVQYEYDGEHLKTLHTLAGNSTPFINPLGLYLSALMYESRQEYGNALVSLNQAKRAGHHPLVNQKIKEINQLKKGHKRPGPRGRIVFILEDGLISPEEQITIPITTELPLFPPNHLVAIPFYPDDGYQSPNISLVDKDHNIHEALFPIVNLQGQAAAYLELNIPNIIAKEIAKVLVQNQTKQIVDKDNDNGLSDLIELVSLMTASADLRSWLTLPHEIQIAELSLTPDTYKFTAIWNKNQSIHLPDITLSNNQIMLVWLAKIGDDVKIKLKTSF